jgi:hypothetical protein
MLSVEKKDPEDDPEVKEAKEDDFMTEEKKLQTPTDDQVSD